MSVKISGEASLEVRVVSVARAEFYEDEKKVVTRELRALADTFEQMSARARPVSDGGGT